MLDLNVVAKTIKEASPYASIVTGGGMTQTSLPILQIVGIVIAGAGVVVAIMRWYEARLARKEEKRANDLKQLKYDNYQKRK